MTKRKRNFIIRWAALIIISFTALTTAYALANPPEKYLDLLTPNTPAYRGAPFVDDPQFWIDMKSAAPKAVKCDGSYHSQYYNIEAGCIRRVVGQPDVSRRVWLFGSSTIVNIESPDQWTLPSQLQARLTSWRVEMRSRNAATALTQVALMKDQPVQAGDVVVLYGVWKDVHEMERGDTSRTKAYRLALDMARDWCAARGARLIVVAQPIVWSRKLSQAEQDIIALQLRSDPNNGPSRIIRFRLTDNQHGLSDRNLISRCIQQLVCFQVT